MEKSREMFAVKCTILRLLVAFGGAQELTDFEPNHELSRGHGPAVGSQIEDVFGLNEALTDSWLSENQCANFYSNREGSMLLHCTSSTEGSLDSDQIYLLRQDQPYDQPLDLVNLYTPEIISNFGLTGKITKIFPLAGESTHFYLEDRDTQLSDYSVYLQLKTEPSEAITPIFQMSSSLSADYLQFAQNQ